MWRFSTGLRHPLYPELKPVSAVGARGRHAVLAGTFAELMSATVRGATAGRAIFVLRVPGQPFLTEPERDVLWDLFQVPILVLLVNDHSQVLAYECEAQQGLHLDRYALPAGCAAVVEAAPCGCGRPGHRLVPADKTRSAAERELPLAV